MIFPRFEDIMTKVRMQDSKLFITDKIMSIADCKIIDPYQLVRVD